MQNTNQVLRYELWDHLKPIFEKYADPHGMIKTERVEEIVRDVLGETTPQEIQYVMKNMFRLDKDGSGGVDFLQFGNFLFKRHCGEIALQVMHKKNSIQRGSDRMINLKEFFALVNNAYAFLGVKMDMALAEAVFKEADKDHDGYITYVEYFQYIEKCICQTREQYAEYRKLPEKVHEPAGKIEVVNLGREWNSRLRRYLWSQLKKLYEAYVYGRNLTVNDENLRGLVKALLGDLSEVELTFLMNGLFKLDRGTIQFIPFAKVFFYLIAELGLSRYQKNHDCSKKTLNAEQFVVLLRNTFKFLNLGRLKKCLLLKIFGKIDTNHDGLISIAQYLDWVHKFLAVEMNHGDEYYLTEDDEAIDGTDIFEATTALSVLPDVNRGCKCIKFHFSNYDLSDEVRKRMWDLLIKYDKNHDHRFDENEIHDALIDLLKENQHELDYVTRNVFRYDKDGDRNVTYEELTNFCVQQHFGEMAIQRLHKKGATYSRGKDRMMNQAEFETTLNNALAYIQLKATPEQVSRLFKEIDLEKTGWISYEVYFLFLVYYFGSLRGTPYPENKNPYVDPDKAWLDSLSGLSPLDRLIRLLLDQLVQIFARYDSNKNMVLEEDEIEAILRHVLGLNDTEVSYLMLKYFNLSQKANKCMTFTELAKLLMEIYFIQIILKRKYKDVNATEWKSRKLSLRDFITLFTYACNFMRAKPAETDLTEVFKTIDTDHDGYISFSEYVDFIRKYLGLGIQNEPEVKHDVGEVHKPDNVSTEEWDFINEIWGELKTYFDKYDTGAKGYLTEDNMKKFVVEVLQENTQRELDYIFWNFFRVDPNTDRKTEFNEFAPFILLHAGEIALQRFHREQVRGKKTLTEPELFIVFSSAFNFLSTMPKSKPAVHSIYRRIGKGTDPTYGAYLGWINSALANKFK